ncbi:YceI family protein [Amaricoccus sp.]|uniref:YceI family protein n=1 Tax=Amaricoccus sp. TaxID=1872485 RepID=UPI001B780247|nr:YceI family protein [Amaricoccus sp.]MBP7240661.1 YceI family protein [Amaricoccus sp.]
MRLVLALLLVCLPLAAAAAPWRLDPATRVAVDVSWKGSTVELTFPELSGTIDFDEKRPETTRARIVVAAGSVEAALPPAAVVVKGPDFLGVGRWPEVVFELDRLTPTSKSTADVAGRLTLRGITKPVSFKATVTQYGPAPDDPDRFVASFDITGSVDRTAFGSTGGLPDVAARIGLRIHLAMASE